jgi:hypothetical protein
MMGGLSPSLSLWYDDWFHPKTGLAMRRNGDYPAKKLFVRRASESPEAGSFVCIV